MEDEVFDLVMRQCSARNVVEEMSVVYPHQRIIKWQIDVVMQLAVWMYLLFSIVGYNAYSLSRNVDS